LPWREQPANPRDEFRRAKWLDHIVVGSGIESTCHVVLRRTRAQYENRHPTLLLLPKPSEQFDTVEVEHIPVDQKQVESLAPPDAAQVYTPLEADATHWIFDRRELLFHRLNDVSHLSRLVL